MRRVLLFLWDMYGAEKLDGYVRRYKGIRPRNVTATQGEKEALLTLAPVHLRLWILLCSDLAIRSGTAARLRPEHYDAEEQVIRLETKFGNRQTIPVTMEIAALLRWCDMRDNTSFVRQLWKRFRPNGQTVRDTTTEESMIVGLRWSYRRLLAAAGIKRRLTLHDFRRTTAVAMYKATGDLRDVQALLGHRDLAATLWYIDHDLRPISRNVLEAIKAPNTERKLA